MFDWSNRMIGSDDPEYQGIAEDRPRARRPSFTPTPKRWPTSGAPNPRDDIVTALLKAEVDGERSPTLEFDLFFLLLAVAGNETTRNAISHGHAGADREPRPAAAGCSTTRR